MKRKMFIQMKYVVVKDHVQNSKLDEYAFGPYKISDVETNRLGLLYQDCLQYESMKNVRKFFE